MFSCGESVERFPRSFETINYSNLPVLIDPAEFYVHAFNGNDQPLTENMLKAIDPETEILKFEIELSKNEARELNQIRL